VWIRIPPEKIGEARRFESYFGCGTPEWRYGFESHLVGIVLERNPGLVTVY